jgi:hypothetical protein
VCPRARLILRMKIRHIVDWQLTVCRSLCSVVRLMMVSSGVDLLVLGDEDVFEPVSVSFSGVRIP